MKLVKYLVLLSVLFFSTLGISQDTTYLKNEYNKALGIYQLAQKYNDQDAIKQSLLELMVLNNRDTVVLRSLAELYYNERKYTSSTLVSLDFLEKYPGNLIATELVALSYEQLRLYDKALEYYQAMWIKTSSANILYRIAYLHYSLKRYEESLTDLDLVESELAVEDKIQLSMSNGIMQEVSFKAATLNLRALIAIEQGKNDEAKSYLGEALKLSPEFEAAKSALAGLDK